MLLVALSGRFAPNSTVDTHGHLHSNGLPSDPSEWTAESLARAQLDAVCLFRSPVFQQIDVDAGLLAREFAAGGPNVALLAQILGPNVGALTSGSAQSAASALNAIVLGQPRFAMLVHLDRLGGPPAIRTVLAQARAPNTGAAGAGWMYLDRAALQGMFPAGTRASWRYSEEISDEYLARYSWYAELMATGGARSWLTPSPGQGAGRVRCLLLAPQPAQQSSESQSG
jgi:hypothetical protein